MSDTRFAFVSPEPPKFTNTDVDGDRLLITTAEIPDVGAGVYFLTDPQGSSVPLSRFDELIESLQEIRDALRDEP